MRDAADRTYGWPARIFAKKICEHKAEGSTVVADVIAKWERFFSKRLGIDLTGVEGQVRDKVAAAGAVGMLAKRLGVLPKEINIIPAIDWAWAAIAKQQPKVNASPVEAVAAYIRENKTRFSKTPLPSKYDEADAMALAGIVHEGENDVEFLIPKPAFNAAFGSLGGSKAVMPSLAREGLAVVENLAWPQVPNEAASRSEAPRSALCDQSQDSGQGVRAAVGHSSRPHQPGVLRWSHVARIRRAGGLAVLEVLGRGGARPRRPSCCTERSASAVELAASAGLLPALHAESPSKV